MTKGVDNLAHNDDVSLKDVDVTTGALWSDHDVSVYHSYRCSVQIIEFVIDTDNQTPAATDPANRHNGHVASSAPPGAGDCSNEAATAGVYAFQAQHHERV